MAHKNQFTDFDVSNSYTLIFNNFFDVLFNYGIRIIKDDELVKDCIQELFFRIWKNKIDFSTINNQKSYLIKGLRNQIINILELKQNNITKVDIEDYFQIDFSPEDYYIKDQQEKLTRNRVLDALNQLTKKQKETVYLRYFEDLEYDEIAQIMGINVQSVKNNIQRSYNPLRKYLTRFSHFLLSFF
jgi:RNA polymerase sigma factor (sigma-70 family)